MSHQNPTLVPTVPQASRRALLFGIAAGVAASSAVALPALGAAAVPAAETVSSAPAPAVASPSQDAGLLKLIDDYRTAKAETGRTYDVFTPFEEKDFARKRRLLANMPEALRVRPEDAGLDLPIKATGGFYGLRIEETGPFSGQRHLGSVAPLQEEAWTTWTYLDSGIRRVSASPSPAARTRADEIIEAHDRLRRRYERKPAGYRAAQRAKDAAMNKLCEILETIRNTRAQSFVGLVAKARCARDDDMDEPMALSLVEDLCALGEQVQS